VKALPDATTPSYPATGSPAAPLDATTPAHPSAGLHPPLDKTVSSHPSAAARRSQDDDTMPSQPLAGNAALTMPSTAVPPRTVAFGKKAGTAAPKISGYEILGTLGEGGMGAVFLARDEMLDRKVAIKVISNQGGDKVAEARFLREARSMATAEHPNIVRVLSFGSVDEQPYIVMELVEGESLSARIARVRRFSPADALRLVRQVIEALAASWQKGIVHRDIKPANILIDQKGNVRVADFGLAKPQAKRDVELTEVGLMVGSPYYVAPEQASGLNTDFHADIYSLGIVLFEMLTGEKPFSGSNAFSIIAKHLHDPFPAIQERRIDLPPGLAALVEKMTRKDPGQRHASYGLLLRDVDQLLESFSTIGTVAPAPVAGSRSASGVPSRGGLIFGLLAAALLVVIGGIVWANRSPSNSTRVSVPEPSPSAAAITVQSTPGKGGAADVETSVASTHTFSPETERDFNEALVLMRSGDLRRAVESTDRILKREPDNGSARLLRSEALFEGRARPDAERELTALLARKQQSDSLDARERFLALMQLTFLRGNDDAADRLRSQSHFAYESDERFVRLLRANEQHKTESVLAAERGSMRVNPATPAAAQPSMTQPSPAFPEPQPRNYGPPPGMYPPPPPPPNGGPPPGGQPGDPRRPPG